MANAKRDGAAPEEVRDLRRSIEWMKKEGDIIVTDKEVDPNLEITGIQKQLDGGCPILFNNVKGKHQHRCITNLFGDMRRKTLTIEVDFGDYSAAIIETA